MNIGLLWLRIFCGTGIAFHGFQKIFQGWMPKFTSGVAEMGFPVPAAFAWAAALSEFLGGTLLVLGFKTRIAGFFVFATMAAAAFMHHAADPLEVKELALAYWVMSGTLLLTGGGRFSLDEKLG